MHSHNNLSEPLFLYIPYQATHAPLEAPDRTPVASRLGAALGAPDRTVVCVVGDGGLQMTIQELATVYQTQAKVKVLLLNNEFLGMVRQWQQLFFDKRYSSTEMINPDFQLLAFSLNIAVAIHPNGPKYLRNE